MEQAEAYKEAFVIKQSSFLVLNNKREDFKNSIGKFKDEPMGSTLTVTYQHYIVILENLNLEYKKNQNILNLKHKEIKLNDLIDQIKLRDDLLSNVKK